MAVAISMNLRDRLKEIVERLKKKGEVIFTFFSSPEELERLLALPEGERPTRVFVSEKEAGSYLKLKEKYLPSAFFLYIFGEPLVPEPYLSTLRRALLVDFISSPEEAEEFLKEDRKLKWWVAVIEDDLNHIKQIKKAFAGEDVHKQLEIEPVLRTVSWLSPKEEDFVPVGGEPTDYIYRLKSPEEVLKEIEAKSPSGIILDLGWRRSEKEEEMAKKWCLYLDREGGVTSEEFVKEWEKGDLDSELFQVSGLRFLKLVEGKIKRGDSVPPIFVLTMYVREKTTLPPAVRDILMKNCNVFAMARKNWDWMSGYDGAEYITFSFLRHTANYYRGMRKSYPPFKCLLTEKAEESDYLLIPFGKKEKEIEKLVTQAYLSRYGGDTKVTAEKLGVSEQTVKNKVGRTLKSRSKSKIGRE